MADINLEIAEELLVIVKQMFKQYTQVDIDFCKKIISIDEKITALKGNKPPEKPKTFEEIIDEPKKEDLSYIQKVGRTERGKTIPINKEPTKSRPVDKEVWKEADKTKIPLNTSFDEQPPEKIPEKEKKPFDPNLF